MTRCRCSGFLVSSVVAFLASFPSYALQVPAEKTNDIAALAALRGMLKQHSYELPEKTVRDIVLRFLRKDNNPSPKKMPDAGDLQGDLNLDFESSWTEMINQASAGLGTGIAERFRERLKQSDLKTNAKKDHDKFVSTSLPNALKNVEANLIKEQTEQLVTGLKQVVGPEMPGQDRVSDAQAGNRANVSEALTAAAFAALPDEQRAVVIRGSYDALAAAADNVVTDGIQQLEEQLTLLTQRPDAIAQGAIEAEFGRRLQALATGQDAGRKGLELRPSYGVFTQVSKALPDRARDWFDQHVADAVARVSSEVEEGKHAVPDQYVTALQQTILDDVAKHHEPIRSWRILQPTIGGWIKECQQWVVTELEQDRQKSKAAEDQNYAEKQFAQDVGTVLEARDTKSRDSWRRLAERLEQRYESEVLPAIRSQIADRQAAEYAPTLMAGTWRPKESDLNGVVLPLRRQEHLTNLPIWAPAPPQATDTVLEETWYLWVKAAQSALAITQEVRNIQLKIVEELQPLIRDQIARDSQRTYEKWVSAYTDQTLVRWREENPLFSEKYPDLFNSTLDQIELNVSKLLPMVEKEQAEKEPAEIQPAPEAPPVAPDPDAMSQTPPGQPVQTDPAAKVPATDQSSEPREDAQSQGDNTGANDSEDGPGGEGDGSGGQGEGENGKGDGDGAEDEEQDSEEQGEDADEEKDAGEQTDQAKEASLRKTDTPVLQFAPYQRSWADVLYDIALFVLLGFMLLMAAGWYWHVRYLRRLLARYHRPLVTR